MNFRKKSSRAKSLAKAAVRALQSEAKAILGAPFFCQNDLMPFVFWTQLGYRTKAKRITHEHAPQRNCVTQLAGHDQMRAQGTKSQGAGGLEPFLTDSLLVLGKGQSREQSILRR